MRIIVIGILFLSSIFQINAQMVDGNTIKYGNEWIDYNKEYFKIPISEDAVYHISTQQLINAGIDMNDVSGKDFQLYAYGEQVPIYTSTQEKFGSNDYIEFYGEKNRSQLDYYLFRFKYFMLNPEYSLFTDTAAYFLTWDKSTVNERYIELDNDLTGSLPPKENYYMHDERIINSSEFIKPLRDIKNKIYKSNFDIGEGFGSVLQESNSFTLNTSDFFNIGQKPTLSIRFTTNLGKHNLNVYLNDKLIKQSSENGFACKTYEIPIDINDITSQMNVTMEGVNNIDYKDRNSVSILSFIYSREFKFLNKDFFKFKIENSPFSKYLEIEDFDINGNSFVLYDKKNNTRLIPSIDQGNNLVKFLLPPNDSIRELVLVNLDKKVKSVSALVKTEFYDFLQLKDKNYIILSDKDKFIDENQKNWVEEYANYRSSLEGGNYNTTIVNVKDIYDQFGYGISRHSQGLNNFLIYVKDNFTNPEYIFIIGKGLEYSEIRTKAQLEEVGGYFHVPTFGYPGSDNLLTARYNSDYPELPIGRIAAKTHDQIRMYLDKVKSYENYLQYPQTIEDKEWMKKVIHLVGGDENIITQIGYSLKTMANIISNNKFGANVNTYERTSSDAQESVTEKIIDDIQSGAGIVTFYGHSSIVGTDFNIANLENDRFPVFFSLGCYSGNIHTTVLSGQSESFVLDDRGVIAYIGTSGTGFTGNLATLGKKIYEYAGTSFYGEGVGEIVQRAIKTIGETNFDIGSITLNQQFTYHGDPAITFYKHPGPDYLIDFPKTKTLPGIINSNSDEFELNFDVVNLGLGIDDSLSIRVLRKVPSTGTTDIINKKIKAPKSRSTVSLTLPTYGVGGIGENCVSIFLDPTNQIEELPSPMAEENNQLSNQNGENSYCFYIINNGAETISPKEFSIVHKPEVNLQASTYNYFIESNKYLLQIDTTELFNSPVMKETAIISKGGLINWKPDLDFQHNSVYYWRISPDSISPTSSYNWDNSSFIYLVNSSEGWNQSHYYQYQKDEFAGTVYDGRKFDFEAKKYNIRIIGKKYNPDDRKVAFIDGETWGEANPSRRPTFNILTWGPDYWFRNKTGHDYNSNQNPYEFGSNFDYTPYYKEHVQGMKELFEALPDSMTVYFYTVLGDETQSLKPELWAQDSIELGYNLYSLLESYGATKIRKMETKGTVPYVLIFKKGYGVLKERIGKTIDEVFEVEQDVTINLSSGRFISKFIGPAKEWDQFVWNVENTGDSTEYYYVKVHKFDKDQNQDIIVDSLTFNQPLDLSGIDAKKFPYLKLEFFAYDRFKRDPPKINYWRVFYKGFPDAVLVNNDEAYFYKDTMEFGDEFKFKTYVYNNTSIDMDSLLVEYKIKKQNNQEVVVTKRYPPLLADTSYFISFEYPTNDLQGINEFSVHINANNEQQEKYYFNNVGIKKFYVRMDRENPLMDVTFNGRHIMDGDIIAPRSEINIMLKDNNKYLLLDDISIFKKLTIITPSGVINDIPIEANSELEFLPAESILNNKAQLIYKHVFMEEGEYQLIAQASDISGNLSGENEYKISFLIILKEQISNVYNYPNPFSTKTKFVFTLTGMDTPENIVIKIMTLSGKVVRELTNVDLGEFEIGNNITEKSWDGTDEYGRKIANGVYLYQVKAVNSQGEEFELMETGDSDNKFFKQGFGKLVILR